METKFDTDGYLQTRFCNVNMKERILFPLEMFHKEFSALPASLKILDYGTGPVIMSLISASSKASEIIVAEYSPENRKALRLWLDDKPEAFDWSPYFRHVVCDLEGRGDEEIGAREALVREKVKKVVSCNICNSPIIEEGYEGPYDVVSSSCCLEAVGVTREDFKLNVEKIAAFLKPGGTMLLYLSERDMKAEKGEYYIGSQKYGVVNVNSTYVEDVLKNIGFYDVKSNMCPCDTAVVQKTFQDADLKGYMFVSGVKMQ